jgi:hypothetical protein
LHPRRSNIAAQRRLRVRLLLAPSRFGSAPANPRRGRRGAQASGASLPTQHGGDGWLHGKKPRVRAGLRRHAKRVAKRPACSSHIRGTTNGQATAAKRPRTAWRPPNSEIKE